MLVQLKTCPFPWKTRAFLSNLKYLNSSIHLNVIITYTSTLVERKLYYIAFFFCLILLLHIFDIFVHKTKKAFALGSL